MKCIIVTWAANISLNREQPGLLGTLTSRC